MLPTYIDMERVHGRVIDPWVRVDPAYHAFSFSFGHEHLCICNANLNTFPVMNWSTYIRKLLCLELLTERFTHVRTIALENLVSESRLFHKLDSFFLVSREPLKRLPYHALKAPRNLIFLVSNHRIIIQQRTTYDNVKDQLDINNNNNNKKTSLILSSLIL